MSGRSLNVAVVVVAASATAVLLPSSGQATERGAPVGYAVEGRIVNAPRATGGGYALAGTITHGTAPAPRGEGYAVTGGLWAAAGTTTSSQAAPPPHPADHNHDGAVDEHDLAQVLGDAERVDGETIDAVLGVLDAWGVR